MALLGGGVGGAGNPVGGSFTGPAEALEIIGDHAYAYSGTFESVNASQTMLSFTSGNFYTVGEFSFNGPIDFTGATQGGVAVYNILFNGSVVAAGKSDTATQDMPAQTTQKVIISPYTEVEFKARCDEDSSDELISAIYTGRIYRTRD